MITVTLSPLHKLQMLEGLERLASADLAPLQRETVATCATHLAGDWAAITPPTARRLLALGADPDRLPADVRCSELEFRLAQAVATIAEASETAIDINAVVDASHHLAHQATREQIAAVLDRVRTLRDLAKAILDAHDAAGGVTGTDHNKRDQAA